jgi:preprotein translocase subunit SecG
MTALVLAGSGFLYYSLATIFLVVCLFLILIVVITPSQEGGMAAAFGGMGSDSFFGTKAHQHINKFMVFLAAGFLVLAVVINRVNSNATAESSTGQPTKSKLLGDQPPAPTLPPPPSAPPPGSSAPKPAEAPPPPPTPPK